MDSLFFLHCLFREMWPSAQPSVHLGSARGRWVDVSLLRRQAELGSETRDGVHDIFGTGWEWFVNGWEKHSSQVIYNLVKLKLNKNAWRIEKNPPCAMGCLEILLDATATLRELHLIFSGCEGYQKASVTMQFASEIVLLCLTFLSLPRV